MRLYLVQHGKSLSEAEDPRRPLSPEGREETQRMADWLRELGIRVPEIWHSTKLRARETAEILAEALGARTVEKEGLAPLDDPLPVAEVLKDRAEDLLIAGHLPFLSRLTSLLLTGDPEKEVVKFRFSGCLALLREDFWRMDWFLKPELRR
ncbi:phosphohistidine phosphatase SixA [Thermosulfurimonas marina]|uniref:Phosphohistidine phosphatase SixA n=1 Tax=Thermosulfurimonas marina TaxID=2047767 RepID=A0A6H1WTU4_9BACT|nr:phosphohistidine phosphatase SixA [Thermosulfurimonas marina]QJA06600.1 phosphohistidine phosphatase SixA [Thermosulfurimonas marina]